MRKKDLTRNLEIARARIEALEDIICPAHQHEWFTDYEEECRICRRCRKVIWLESYEI